MEYIFYGILGCGSLAIICATLMSVLVLSADKGTADMQRISSYIYEGAKAYLNRQYTTIFIVGIIIATVLILLLNLFASIGFILGAFLSGIVGYIGMHVSVRSNVRTAEAARKGLKQSLGVAFRSGAITGLLVVGLGLIGITGFYLYLLYQSLVLKDLLESLLALSFGASFISIFSRLGGGIFTKGADIGADLVGKIQLEISEDEPRKQAVIADNVGDNVGDCVGMAADLFETYIMALVGSICLAAVYFRDILQSMMMLYPLMIGAVCIVGFIFGTFFVRLSPGKGIMHAFYKGIIATAFLSASLCVGVAYYSFDFMGQFFPLKALPFDWFNLATCSLVGLSITGLLMFTTEYYTSTAYHPVQSLAEASTAGYATNIIHGLSLSMQSTFFPLIVVCVGILVSYMSAGLFGISIAAVTMLSLAGMIVSLGAFGPIVDNASGIAEMAHLGIEVRAVTDVLDTVGNTTKAIAKGYGIGSSGLSALVLFTVFTESQHYYYPSYEISFSLKDPFVFIGLLAGGLLSYAFAAMALQAVGKAGAIIVREVRRQFKEIPGIIEGTNKPDYKISIDFLTKSAIKQMILPSLLPVVVPICLYGLVLLIAGQFFAFSALGAMLIGTIIFGFFLAISMTSGGGAWDNAKKYIESGHFGGKGSQAHKVAITGDTVGDPYKDTAGPALNPMIKITHIVALLLLAILSR